MSRRFFLGGVLTVVASVALPAMKLEAAAQIPVLYGDGIHDDAAALQAFIDGTPFRTVDGFAGSVAEGEIHGGRYLLSTGLGLSKATSSRKIRYCTWAHPESEDTHCDEWRIA